jgi:N-acetylglucosamine kinase-like BadF-type ATPase
MSLVLGLDAGNTKTIALVAHCDGRIAGSGRGGCGDIYARSPEQAMAAVDNAIAAALPPGAGLDAIGAACFSMAGADWPEDYALIRAALAERGLERGERLLIYNDALGALRAGTPDGVGVSVVCGTGAAVGARAADGRFWHSSWWQEPQGANQLGQKTLRAVYRAALGLAPPTSLTERVLDFYQAPDVEAVLHRLTARVRQPAPPVGQLSRALLDEAAAGDPTARGIVVAHGADLGDYALMAARRVGLSEAGFPLVLAGGVLRHTFDLLPATLIARVRAAVPGVRPVISRLEPAAGALLFGLEADGVAITAAVLDNLTASLPPAAFFET